MGISTWATMPFDKTVQVNLVVPLKHGATYAFVGMQAVEPNLRNVKPSEIRKFKGGGSRFRAAPCAAHGTRFCQSC